MPSYAYTGDVGFSRDVVLHALEERAHRTDELAEALGALAEIVVEEARGVDEVELPAPELDRRLIEATPGPLDEVAIALQDAGSCEVDCAELVGKAVQAGGQIIPILRPEVAPGAMNIATSQACSWRSVDPSSWTAGRLRPSRSRASIRSKSTSTNSTMNATPTASASKLSQRSRYDPSA
jgi:hypothetical protein